MVVTLLAGILILGQQSPTVELKAIFDGRPVGTAWITDKLSPDGSKKSQIKLLLKQDGGETTVVEETQYAKDGMPVRKYLRKTAKEGSEMRIATFSGRTAHIVTERDAKRETSQVEAPANVELRAICEYWFLRDRPVVGTVWEYYRFDMDKLAWLKTVVRYVKVDQVKVAGKVVKMNRIDIEGLANSWHADDGKAQRVVMGKLVLAKVGP
jgi:hypothetical protein